MAYWVSFADELARVGVVFVELAVAAPVDGEFELALRVLFAEAASEQVEEEAFAEVAVGGGGERVADGPHERGALVGVSGEELLAGEDVGGGDLSAGVGDLEVGFLDGGEAEELGGVDEREEVVDLEAELVGELGEVFAAADRDEDLEEAGETADGRVGQRLLAGRDRRVDGGGRGDGLGFAVGRS